MARKPRNIPTPADQQSVIETIMDRLTGVPVSVAMDILELAKKQIMYLATVSKPEDDLAARQMKFEAIPHSCVPFNEKRSRRKAA